MRKTRYIIKPWDNTGRKFNWQYYAVIFLLLDHFHAPHWLWWGYGVIAALYFIAYVVDCFLVDEVPVDINDILAEHHMFQVFKEEKKKENH